MSSEKSIEIAEFRQQLNKKGLRLTGQRRAVMEIILNNRGKHLSSKETFELVKQSYPGIGLATVYRTLLLFEQMKLLIKVYLDDGCIRYELCDLKQKVHYHLICMECGAVYEVEEDLLGIKNKQILKNNYFDIRSYTIKFNGYCIKCKLKMIVQYNCNLSPEGKNFCLYIDNENQYQYEYINR